jgi:hypothetical protein
VDFVDRPAIVTGSTPAGAPPPQGVDRYQGAVLSAPIGTDVDLHRTQIPGALPVYRLMQSQPSGQANVNSGVHSNAAPLIFPVASAAHAAQTTATAAQETADAVAAVSFQGAYNPAVSYSQGASVDASGTIYVSLINNNIGNTPSSSPTDWVATGGSNTSVFLGAYNAGTTYAIGNQVTFGTPSGYYISLVNSNTGNTPSTSPTKWQLVSTVNTDLYEGAYSGATAYVPGNFVSFTDGNFYVCISNTTGNAPSPTGSSFWTLLGSSAVLLGAYNAGTAYKTGMQVTSGGGVFTALQSTTGNAPPTPPSSNSFWSYLGPSDLSIVPDSSQRFAATASTLTYRPTSNPLTATDAGSNATVSIAAFTMRTSSKGDVSINSGSITALSYSTLYFIYYDDPTLAGGAVTYNATTTKVTAIQGSGRFFVGSILTPKATAPNTTGNNDGGVGAQNGGTSVLFGSVATPTVTGVGTVTNPLNAIDGDPTTFADVVAHNTTGTNGSATLVASGFIPFIATSGSATLNIISSASLTTAPSSGQVGLSYSLNGGASFTTVYSIVTSTSRSKQTDSVSLALSQNTSFIQVKALCSTGSLNDNAEIKLYEAYVLIIQ